VQGQPSTSRHRAELVVRRNPTAAAEFQRRLADAIERLVDADTSYGELSVDQLTNEAGVARSTFYKYFGDKSGLLTSLVVAVRDDFLQAADAWLAMTAGGARAEYEQSFQKIFDAYRTHRVVMRCIVEQSTQDSVIGAQFQEMMAVFVAAIEQHIVQGQRVGVITDSRSPKNLAVWLTWMLEFGQMKLIGPADERTVRKYTAAVTDIVWKTLYADASSHG
jgi:AcrR family transcriptional regulator